MIITVQQIEFFFSIHDTWVSVWSPESKSGTRNAVSHEVSRKQATDIFLVCNKFFILMFLYSGEKLDT